MENTNVAPKGPTAEEQLKAVLAENASLKTQVSEQDAIIKELQAKLEAAASVGEKASGAVVVSHAKENYKVLVASFKFKGAEYKASDLKSNKELVKSLVEAGVGFLVKL